MPVSRAMLNRAREDLVTPHVRVCHQGPPPMGAGFDGNLLISGSFRRDIRHKKDLARMAQDTRRQRPLPGGSAWSAISYAIPG